MKNNQIIIMILSIGIPILLILLLPNFGFSSDKVYTYALIVFIGLHFLMMGSHGRGHNHGNGLKNKQGNQNNHRNNSEIKNSDS